MSRTRFATDAVVAATAAATAVASTPGATPLTGDGATDLDTFSAAAVVDITAIKVEIAELRTKMGV